MARIRTNAMPMAASAAEEGSGVNPSTSAEPLVEPELGCHVPLLKKSAFRRLRSDATNQFMLSVPLVVTTIQYVVPAVSVGCKIEVSVTSDAVAGAVALSDSFTMGPGIPPPSEVISTTRLPTPEIASTGTSIWPRSAVTAGENDSDT